MFPDAGKSIEQLRIIICVISGIFAGMHAIVKLQKCGRRERCFASLTTVRAFAGAFLNDPFHGILCHSRYTCVPSQHYAGVRGRRIQTVLRQSANEDEPLDSLVI